MGEMGGSVGDGPILHCGGNSIGNIIIKADPFVDGFFQRLINLIRKGGFHYPIVEYKTAEII